MLVLSETHVRRCLTIDKCMKANRIALGSLRSKDTNQDKVAVVPTRIAIPYRSRKNMANAAKVDIAPTPSSTVNSLKRGPNAEDTTLFKPAGYFPRNQSPVMGLKVVSVRANNPSNGKPLVPANIMLLDAETGEVSATVAATYLTAARTAAGSAIATEFCLNRTLHSNESYALHLVVVGAGLQAELHITYLCQLPILMKRLGKITIINRSSGRAQALRESMKTFFEEQNIGNNAIEIDCISFEDNVEEVVGSANVIVTCTNTKTPLFNWDWVQPGCHINGVGSYLSDSEEVCSKFIKERCSTIVDTIEALNVGDLREISDQSIDGSFEGLLGDVLSGESALPCAKPSSQRNVSLYKCVGTAIQDIITAEKVVEVAKSLDMGTVIDMS